MLLVALVMVVLAASCSSGSSTGDEEGPSSSSVTDVSLVQANDTSLLEVVRARGVLICGVSGAAVGFSMAQPDGTHTGIDADMCRAIASAVLGDALAVRFEPVTADQGVDAIRTGAVDVLLRHAEATLEVDAARRLDFGPTTYFDGQQVLGRAPTRCGPRAARLP